MIKCTKKFDLSTTYSNHVTVHSTAQSVTSNAAASNPTTKEPALIFGSYDIGFAGDEPIGLFIFLFSGFSRSLLRRNSLLLVTNCVKFYLLSEGRVRYLKVLFNKCYIYKLMALIIKLFANLINCYGKA